MEIAGAATVDSGAVLAMAGGSLKSSLLTNEGMIHTTSGNSIIFGNVHSNGSFQAETGSSLIFADDFFGADEFSGGGAVTFQGGLNPGLSPGTIEFSGDVILGENSMTTIEIAGLTSDEFDRLVFANPDSILTIEEGAALDVQLINGFGLGYSQEFIFSDLAGSNSTVGTFSGLGEGDLVGSFGGFDLFISYAAGSGNDISLFTAVPEPSTFLVAAITLGALGIPRRRRKRIIA